MTQPLTVLGRHRQKWAGGCGSEMCGGATKVCLFRGVVPCDVTFIAEAPGKSEDVMGRPLVGPAGQLLDRIVKEASASVRLCGVCGSAQESTPSGDVCRNGHGGADGRDIRIAFTNMVGCIPRGEDGKKTEEPDDCQVEACRERLEEFLGIAKPRLVVAVGGTAKGWLHQGYKHSTTIPDGCKVVDVVHPAAILRANITTQSIMYQRCVVVLRDAFEDL